MSDQFKYNSNHQVVNSRTDIIVVSVYTVILPQATRSPVDFCLYNIYHFYQKKKKKNSNQSNPKINIK